MKTQLWESKASLEEVSIQLTQNTPFGPNRQNCSANRQRIPKVNMLWPQHARYVPIIATNLQARQSAFTSGIQTTPRTPA